MWFSFIIFKGKSLSWVHVYLCAQACVPRIFFKGRCFWRMHVYACSHDMHILYGCVHTRGTTMLHTIAPHMCARWASFERQTYFYIFNFVFFLIFIWFRLSLDLFIHEFLLVYSLFSMMLLSFLQLHTKIRASHYLVNIMEEVQFVSSNIEEAFEQCSCMWSDVGGTQHETICLLIIKSIYFMNSYLECTVLVFFSVKAFSIMNCSFMRKLLIFSCTRFVPWICQFIWWLHSPWNTQLRTAERRVIFWREYIMNNNKTCIWVGMFPFVKILFIWKRNRFWQMYDLLSFFFFFFLVGQPARFFWGL